MVRCVFHSVICCTIMHICMQVHVGVYNMQTCRCRYVSSTKRGTDYALHSWQHNWAHVYGSSSGTPMECLLHSNRYCCLMKHTSKQATMSKPGITCTGGQLSI